MLANLNVCDNYKAQQWLSFIQNESMVIFHKEVYHHTLEYFSTNQNAMLASLIIVQLCYSLNVPLHLSIICQNLSLVIIAQSKSRQKGKVLLHAEV